MDDLALSLPPLLPPDSGKGHTAPANADDGSEPSQMDEYLNEGLIAGLIFLLTLAFAAGLYVMALRVATRQVNGLGRRLNRIAAAVIHPTLATA